jgi:hypothetical protein
VIRQPLADKEAHMQLTATKLADLIRSLRASALAGTDKRKNPRAGLRTRAEIHIHQGSTRMPIWIRDVSAGGINILGSRYLEIGTRFSLMLDGDRVETALCETRFCRKVGSELFNIGARFIDYPPRRTSRN